MTESEREIVEAIKTAQAQELKRYVIKAWAMWGTPEQRHIVTVPVSLAPTLDPAIILERATTEARAEILRCGYTEQEAQAARLTFEAVEE